jgi:hypothetical protein
LLGVHSRYGLHTRAVTVFRDTLSEGFSHFVTSMTAPVASGWSVRRVGFAPTGKRRLVTAHGLSGLSHVVRPSEFRVHAAPTLRQTILHSLPVVLIPLARAPVDTLWGGDHDARQR